MFEFLDNHPDVSVQDAEYIRLLGYPQNHVLEGRPLELARWTRTWYQQYGKPWVYARKVDQFEINNDQIRIDGTRFGSKRLRDQFSNARANDAFVVAVSAGEECEVMARKLWLEEKPDEYFFLEMYGSAVVEHLIAHTGFQLCEWADRRRVAVLPHNSPGYPGWDISDQQHLLDVIQGQRRETFPTTLQVLDTGMLSPKKSLLAVFGITSHLEKVERLTSLIPCQNCSLPLCQYRRIPYRQVLPQIESVQGMQSTERRTSSPKVEVQQAIIPDAKYTISLSALRKWSEERLRLRVVEDGSVEAQFRYEGTTCSNLGHPLEFLYYVKLGSPENRYKVESVRCNPAPTDEGYKYMCEYLENGDTFISLITDETPLLGKPLDDVLTWERQHNPSGCYCESASRQHKWGLVFEVLHYALARKNNGTSVEFKSVNN